MPTEPLKFWAYLHSNGTVQTKRWWGDVKDYTEDCMDNPFMVRIITPFVANDMNHAREIAWAKLNPNPKQP